MALRIIRTEPDEILRKNSKEVTEITPRIIELVKDMEETMRDVEGVGIAAVQVGVLKKIFVVDIGEGPIVFINPEMKLQEGEEVDVEGCLSLPGYEGEVLRPKKVVVEALNIEGKKFKIEAEGLLARVICHENDHLYGVLYKDVANDYYIVENEEEEEVL